MTRKKRTAKATNDIMFHAVLLHDECKTLKEIAAELNIHPTYACRLLQRAGRSTKKPPEPRRPEWSYPDAATLALVRQIRKECGMEAAS
jgi:AraC-like DNA-binding protein